MRISIPEMIHSATYNSLANLPLRFDMIIGEQPMRLEQAHPGIMVSQYKYIGYDHSQCTDVLYNSGVDTNLGLEIVTSQLKESSYELVLDKRIIDILVEPVEYVELFTSLAKKVAETMNIGASMTIAITMYK